MRRFDGAIMGGPGGLRYVVVDPPPWRVDRWLWAAWQVFRNPRRLAARIRVPDGAGGMRRVLGLQFMI